MLHFLLPLLFLLLGTAPLIAQANAAYDADRALGISQAAIGNRIGNYAFTDQLNRQVTLHDFAGRPLVISMIFTSCHHVCPTTTRRLDEAVAAAREVLGDDSFEVVTIGFDAAADTPEAMRAFAREQGMAGRRWHFLSGSQATIDALSDELGFQFFASPRGFDHINQTTVIDRESRVHAQVYGVQFELPWLIEPLKQLVFNRPESAGHLLSSFIDRVRLFCTVYNPASGRYEIDNSLFIQIAIGFMVVLSVAIYLWRGFRPKRLP
ncbi:MAG: SCO family protein [Woeseiaceae bacterium]|nr:SCO family protein [Woeseiaceae bacterium]